MINAASAVILAVSLVLGCLAVCFFHEKHLKGLSFLTPAVLAGALIQPSPLALGAAGFFTGMALEHLKSSGFRKPTALGDQAFTFKGKVAKAMPSRYGQDVLTVRISETLGRKRFPVDFNLGVTVQSAEGIVRGDEIVFRSFMKGTRTRNGTSVIRGGGIDGSWQYGAGSPSLVHQSRMRLKEGLRHLPDSPASRFLGAVSLGERWRVDARTRDILRKTGTYHLLAISGVHIGAAILPFILILRFGTAASQRVRPRETRLLLLVVSILAAGTYLCFTGLSASALRAVAYFSITGAALVTGRSAFSMASLSWCVLAIICFDDHQQPDISLILSALAVAGIISGSRGLKDPGFFKGTFRITLSAFLFTLPVVVWLAHGISIVTVIGNLAAGLSFGFFLIPSAVLIDFAALLPSFPLEPVIRMWVVAADLFMGFLVHLACMPYSFLDLSCGGCLAATLAAVTGVTVWWRNQYSTRSGIVISLVIVAFSGVGQFIHNGYDRDRLIINFPAVGQADAAIIRRNGMTILMDCGPRGLPGRDCPVTRSLRRLGIRKINAIYLSHLHPDHAGGLREILALWPVEAVYSPEEPGREVLPKLMPEEDVIAPMFRILKYGDVVRLWPFSFRVVGPDPAEKTGNNMNRGSLQILVEVSDFHALFTGDAGWDQVGRILSTLPSLDLLKIPHHGSRNGFPPDGLEAVFNRLQRGAGFKAVCPSDLPGNRHLPAAEVADWFAERGIELVYTGVNGVIIRY